MVDLLADWKLSRISNILRLCEGYPDAQRDFSVVAPVETVSDIITKYRLLVDRNQIHGNERNIDYWRKQGWDKFEEYVSKLSQTSSKTQEKRNKLTGRSITLIDTPDWLVVIPIDKDSSCFHGKHTDWCTSKPFRPHYEVYFYDKSVTLIYCLQVKTGNKWAIAVYADRDDIELFDKVDNKITPREFKNQTGLDPNAIIAKAAGHAPAVTNSRETYAQHLQNIEDHLPFETVNAELEKSLWFVKNIAYLMEYCETVKGRWDKVEKLIIRDPEHAWKYARDVIKHRWNEAEPIIATDTDVALSYLHQFFKPGAKWLVGEQHFIKNPSAALRYATEWLERRWPEAELMLAKSPEGNSYAKAFFDGKWAAYESNTTKLHNVSGIFADPMIGEVLEGSYQHRKRVYSTIFFSTVDPKYARPVTDYKQVLSDFEHAVTDTLLDSDSVENAIWQLSRNVANKQIAKLWYSPPTDRDGTNAALLMELV